MKKSVKLIIAAGAVALLAASAAFLPKLFEKNGDETPPEKGIEKLVLFRENDADDSIKSDDVLKSFTYEYKSEAIRLDRLDNGVYTVSGQPDLPLLQERPSAMVDCLRILSVVSRISPDEAHPDEYGFDSSLDKCRVVFTNGNEKIYTFGIYNSGADAYYLSVTGEDDVLLVKNSYSAAFSFGVYDMIAKEDVPYVDLFRLKRAEAVSKDGKGVLRIDRVVEERDSDETDENGEKIKETLTGLFYYYEKEGQPDKAVPKAYVETFVSFCSGLSTSSCVDYDPDESRLVSYGLDPDNACVVTLFYTSGDSRTEEGPESSFVFTLGLNGEKGYFTVSGDRVYAIDGAVASSMLDLIANGFYSVDPDSGNGEEN